MQDFDETTSFFDRTEEEYYLPYADTYQRHLRDAIVGCCPEAYHEQFQPQSRFITRRQFWGVHEAIGFANYQGAILNVQMTIAWDRMGYKYGQEVDEVYRLFAQAQRKLLRRMGVPVYFYTVFERSPTVGLHSHSSVHVPVHAFTHYRNWLVDYLEKADRVGFKRRLHIRRRDERGVQRALGEQWRWFRYCMKGLNPALNSQEREENLLSETDTFTSFHDINHRNTGLVTLRRVRLSQDLLKKSRSAVAYPEKYYLIDGSHRYDDYEYRRGESDRLAALLHCELI